MRCLTAMLVMGALTAGLAGSGAAQEADACRDEVQRLSEGFGFLRTEPDVGDAVAQQPGTRLGADMSEAQRREMTDILAQARSAGESGDAAGCLQSLGTARTMLRQAGFGSPLPGDAAQAGSATGSIGDNGAGQGSGGAGASAGGSTAGGLTSSGAGEPSTTVGRGDPVPGTRSETNQGTIGGRAGSTLGGSAGTGSSLGGGSLGGSAGSAGSSGGGSSGGGSN